MDAQGGSSGRGRRTRYLVAGAVALAVVVGATVAVALPAANARFAEDDGERRPAAVATESTEAPSTTEPTPPATLPPPDPEPGAETSDASEDAAAPGGNASDPDAEGTDATRTPEGASPAEPPEPEMLREGMDGPEVKALQERLAELHYDLGDRDGVFGADTRLAVLAFQKVHGLQRDAVVGPQTRAKLELPITPTPRSPKQGTYVEVDLERQVLFFFEGQQVTRIMSVSTGNHQPYESSSGGTAIATTPTGQFEVQRKIDGMRVSDLGELWRPAYFSGGYAIHGSPSVPPYPASHGCVRVSMAGMDRIFDLLPEGTPIEVYSASRS